MFLWILGEVYKCWDFHCNGVILPESNRLPLEMVVSNRNFLFQGSIFRGYVSFRGGYVFFFVVWFFCFFWGGIWPEKYDSRSRNLQLRLCAIFCFWWSLVSSSSWFFLDWFLKGNQHSTKGCDIQCAIPLTTLVSCFSFYLIPKYNRHSDWFWYDCLILFLNKT